MSSNDFDQNSGGGEMFLNTLVSFAETFYARCM